MIHLPQCLRSSLKKYLQYLSKSTEQPAEPVSDAEIENTVVPKAEEIKTVKEQNNSAPEASKEAVKK